jgi:hypothetical protein
MIISQLTLLRIRNVSDKLCREKPYTRFTINKVFPRKLCPLRDNVEKYGTARQVTDDNIIRHMRLACWRTNATDKLRICNTYCFSAAKIVTRTRHNVTVYVHCLCCLNLTNQTYVCRKVTELTGEPMYWFVYIQLGRGGGVQRFSSQQTSEREKIFKYEFKYPRILRHVEWYIVTDVSKDCSASFFRVKESKKWEGSV